jgi:hypothetical protein
MHGWPEMAAAARSVYDSLPPNERRDAVVFADNYGEASAVAFFAPDVRVISEHNQYWLWASRGFSGKIVIRINGGRADRFFASCTRVATLKNRYAINHEDRIPIWIRRGQKQPLSHVWPEIKAYN